MTPVSANSGGAEVVPKRTRGFAIAGAFRIPEKVHTSITTRLLPSGEIAGNLNDDVNATVRISAQVATVRPHGEHRADCVRCVRRAARGARSDRGREPRD